MPHCWWMFLILQSWMFDLLFVKELILLRDNGNLDQIGQGITDLILWRDVAKSTLWFGVGSLCFLSSCFAQGISFRCDEVIFCLFGLCLHGFLIARAPGEGWYLIIFMMAYVISIFSAICQLGLLLLGLSFFSNSICQRYSLTLAFALFLHLDKFVS